MSAVIYTGFWINRGYGPVRGATLTLLPQDGAILTSAVATFVTVVSAQMWKIIMYATHRIRVSNKRRDGLFHQQQVVFRNSQTPGSVAWSSAAQAVAWRGKVRHSSARCLPWLALSLVYLAAAAAAAVFSSQTSKAAGPMRLLQSQDCGLWAPNPAASPEESDDAFRRLTTRQSLLAAAYTRACYHKNESSPACQTFARQDLPWTQQNNVSCPFGDGICIWGENAAFRMQSANLSSHYDLGVNASPRDRVELRKRSTCAPLHTNGFIQVVNGSEYPNNSVLANDTFYNYMYGPGKVDNFTFQYDRHSRYGNTGYGVESNLAYADYPAGNSSWFPIAPLRRSDADIVLTFITSNQVYSNEPCDDPIFGAHKALTGGDWTIYRTDHYVGVIGCAEQYSICNPASRKCSLFGGVGQVSGAKVNELIGLNEVQARTVDRLIIAAQYSTIYLATTRSGQSLRASDTLSSLSQLPLPVDQWQIELSSWFDAGLATIQQEMVDFVTRPPSDIQGLTYAHAANSSWGAMCDNQITNLTQGTISFSVLGLTLTALLGFIILVVSVTMDWVFSFLADEFGIWKHATDSWRFDDKLSLHKTVCAMNGLGVWSDEKMKKNVFVPTTTHGDGAWIGWQQAKRSLHVSSEMIGLDVNVEADYTDAPLTVSMERLGTTVSDYGRYYIGYNRV